MSRLLWPAVAGACVGVLPATLYVDHHWQRRTSTLGQLDSILPAPGSASPKTEPIRPSTSLLSGPQALFAQGALIWNEKLRSFAANPVPSIPDISKWTDSTKTE